MNLQSCHLFFFLTFLVIFAFESASSQSKKPDNFWQILSPIPDAVIKSGELFVLVKLNTPAEFDTRHVYISIDKQAVSENVKISAKSLSLLWLRPLASGIHEIEIVARTKSGDVLPVLRWKFSIAPEKSRPERDIAGKKNYNISGNVALNSRFVSLEGSGQDLRQEPSKTNWLSVNLTPEYHSIQFPIRLHLTDEKNIYNATENRLQIGMRHRLLDLDYGDNYPYWERNILSGIHVFGLQSQLKLGGLQLQIVRGQLAQPREGSAVAYNATTMLPSTQLTTDSLLINPGTYRRNMFAARLSLGRPSGLQIGFSWLKARDDIGSIKFGRCPKDNLVLGSDFSLRAFNQKMKIQGGLALSVTTNDISNGPATETEIDSLYGFQTGLSPEKFENIIILNTSTTPLDLENWASLAWFLNTNCRMGPHTFSIEYKSTGPAYASFGNPYLQTDQKGYSVSDHFSTKNHKLSGMIRMSSYKNNLGQNQKSSPRNMATLGYLMIRPDSQWPGLSIGLSDYNRIIDNDVQSDDNKYEYSTTSFWSGINYAFDWQQIRHSLFFNYHLTHRTESATQQDGSIYHTFTITLIEQFYFPVTLDVDYYLTRMNEAWLSMKQTNLQGKITYRFHQQNDGWMGIEHSTSGGDESSGKSSRYTFKTGGTFKIKANWHFEVEAGFSEFESKNIQNNYTEKYFLFRSVAGINQN